jgi:parallel beta-helix repeat protein
MIYKTLDIRSNNKNGPNILNTPIAATYSTPISIDGNYELALFIHNKGLTGNGTYYSPYIIENYRIYANTANGIEIMNTDAYIIIRNCNISGGLPNENTGIRLRSTSNVNIINNTLTENKKGIGLSLSSNNTISKNNITTSDPFSQWPRGIGMGNSDNNIISENNIKNTFYGIEFYKSDNNIISRNNVQFNAYGIELNNFCDNCTISENNITNNNGKGLNIYNGCNENIIFGNNISYNKIGIEWFDGCNNNLIYFNDIYENREAQANEKYECIGNQWDNGTTGNYWGDYRSKYPVALNDGTFWKISYKIDGDDPGKDNFPLVYPIMNYEPPALITGYMMIKMSIFIFIGVSVFLLLRKRIHKNKIK